jgi:hypothetical protein
MRVSRDRFEALTCTGALPANRRLAAVREEKGGRGRRRGVSRPSPSWLRRRAGAQRFIEISGVPIERVISAGL